MQDDRSDFLDADMDRVLIYKNLLAAEDHLKELIDGAEGYEEKILLEGDLDSTIWLRDRVMPKEVNPKHHCLVKHYAAAYEAACEVWKVTKSDSDYSNMMLLRALLNAHLEQLWGRKLINCKRCGVKDDADGRTDQRTGTNSDTGATSGRPERTIQSVS